MQTQDSSSSRGKSLLIFILGALTALGPFSIDMYLPGFDSIAKDLGVSTAEVGLSLSSYFIGISAGQLLYGPLLDRFGRKKPLYIGLCLYIIASAGITFTDSLQGLVILRFFQAIGSCAATVAAVAMVRDLFAVQETAKVFALLMLVVGASPMIAPTVGGYVTAAIGWHAVFIILGALGVLVLLASIFILPESFEPDVNMSLKPGPIMRNFMEVIKEPQFYTYALAGALAFAGLFAYVSGSPMVFMEIFHMDKTAYGWVFAGLSIGLIGSSQVNSWVLKYVPSDKVVKVTLICQALTGVVFVIGEYMGWYGLAHVIILLFLFLSCVGFANPNTAALSIAPFKKHAGSAAALMGATQMGVGALASVGVSVFEAGTAMPMVLIMAGTAILAVLVLVIGRRQIKHPIVMHDGEEGVVLH